MKQKMPWGIVAGVCAIFVFYLTIFVVGGYVVLDGVAGATNEHASLFGEWWQTALFAADAVMLAGMILSIVMFIRRKGKAKEVSEEGEAE